MVIGAIPCLVHGYTCYTVSGACNPNLNPNTNPNPNPKFLSSDVAIPKGTHALRMTHFIYTLTVTLSSCAEHSRTAAAVEVALDKIFAILMGQDRTGQHSVQSKMCDVVQTMCSLIGDSLKPQEAK